MKIEKSILIAVFTVGIAQLTIKYGLRKLGELSFGLNEIIGSFIKIFTSYTVLAGLFLLVFSSIFWLIALTKAELSYAYPMLSITYAMVAILSSFLFKEKVIAIRYLGIVLIALGIYLMSKSKNDNL